MSILKGNRPLDFWDRAHETVRKMASRVPARGQEEAFNSGIKRLQKSVANRNIKDYTSHIDQIMKEAKSRGIERL